jgi:hypothetical protein
MSTEPKRQPPGIPVGGQFASHDRADGDVKLEAAQPMPALNDYVSYKGKRQLVIQVDDRTAVLLHDGELTIVSDRDLGLHKPAGPKPIEEVLRKRRGHKFFPAAMKRWPKLGTHDDMPLAEVPIVAHYFSPVADWWVAEVNAETGQAWGYARYARMPENAEWGHFDLPELEAFYPSVFHIVERDMHFDGGPAGDIIPEART